MSSKLVTEPSVETKIRKMQQRVRWQHPQIVERGIDQTCLVIEDGGADDDIFSFLVIGDSGTGRHRTPPYVSETTKWSQGQTLAVRHHLRQVLDAVAVQIQPQTRPLVDLVLNGHAHCFDYLRTGATGHSDAHIPWVICGGSGYSLRRQREAGPVITETSLGNTRAVAKSHLYLGRTGDGSTLKRPYSALRVDVASGQPPQLTVTPLVAEKYDGQWTSYDMEGFVV
jgi:hypothetical protein